MPIESESPLPHRPIRSFVRRESRITAAQRRAIINRWPHFGLALHEQPYQLVDVFQRQAPCILEIGFGNGETLLQDVLNKPDCDFIGIEVHRPGVGHLFLQLEKNPVNNLRVFCEDAREVLQHSIPAASLSKVQIFFPDPWHKKRHHKRRLIQADFVEILRQKLVPGGEIHLATDWQDYAEQMLKVLSENNKLKNNYPATGYAPLSADRPLTKFEARGKRLGHAIWELRFVRKT